MPISLSLLFVRIRAFCLGLEDIHSRAYFFLCFRERWWHGGGLHSLLCDKNYNATTVRPGVEWQRSEATCPRLCHQSVSEEPWGFPVVFDAYQDASKLFIKKLNLNPHCLHGLYLVLTSCKTLDQKSVSELWGVRKKKPNPKHTFTENRDVSSQSRRWCEMVRTLWIPECVTFKLAPAFIKLGSITPLLTLTTAAPFPRVSAVIK